MKHLALRVLFAGAAFAVTAVPMGAVAQPAVASRESFRGFVQELDGAYALVVRDSIGSLRNVRTHRGTIVKPLGIKLVRGMPVTILGHTESSRFIADEIDTPYLDTDTRFTPSTLRSQPLGH